MRFFNFFPFFSKFFRTPAVGPHTAAAAAAAAASQPQTGVRFPHCESYVKKKVFLQEVLQTAIMVFSIAMQNVETFLSRKM